jgi:hypothetical protein
VVGPLVVLPGLFNAAEPGRHCRVTGILESRGIAHGEGARERSSSPGDGLGCDSKATLNLEDAKELDIVPGLATDQHLDNYQSSPQPDAAAAWSPPTTRSFGFCGHVVESAAFCLPQCARPESSVWPMPRLTSHVPPSLKTQHQFVKSIRSSTPVVSQVCYRQWIKNMARLPGPLVPAGPGMPVPCPLLGIQYQFSVKPAQVVPSAGPREMVSHESS